MCELDGTKTAKAADGRNLPANIFLGHFMKPYFKDKTTGIVSKYNQVVVIDLSCICVVTVFHCNLQLSVSFLTLQSLFPSLVAYCLLEMFVQLTAGCATWEFSTVPFQSWGNSTLYFSNVPTCVKSNLECFFNQWSAEVSRPGVELRMCCVTVGKLP